MKNYDDIKEEIESKENGNLHLEGAPLRCNYLKEIASITQRNVISYYSSFLEDDDKTISEIEDEDLTGFINAVSSMDTSVGLDLIINTPGGSVEAAESIIKYLHSKFNDIRVIVVVACLSAGTLIAASSNTILMGPNSFLGPTDPQFFSGIPASSILKEFDRAKKEIEEDPSKKEYWEMRLKGYPIGFNEYVKDSIRIVKDDLREWLSSYMFVDLDDGSKKEKTINKIINTLINPKKTHSYHFSYKDCLDMGLKVESLEEERYYLLYQNLLCLHYCYVLSFQDGKPGKLIEASNGATYYVGAKHRA
ncbi:MAG: ATP-dependent Clp protease proteolytic subunit [Coprobacillus sp.]|nr:ATP-dependent Clp protease proteolytic subunit [Coprobacillus sp.]